MEIFIVIIIGICVLLGLYLLMKSEYRGDFYFTKITNKGKKEVEKFDDGSKMTSFEYSLNAANEVGDEKMVKFIAPDRTKALKMNAYLKLEYNDKKGVLNWHEVAKAAVPAAALEKLNKK